jgi:hypothetical protein
VETEEISMSGEPWEDRLRAAAAKGLAHEEATDAAWQQAEADLDARRLASTRCLEETIASGLKEVIDVAGEVGLLIDLIVEPPDPSVSLQIRSSSMKYELQDDGSLRLLVHLPSGRVDKEPVLPGISAAAVKERAARFVESHVNETVVRRFIR